MIHAQTLDFMQRYQHSREEQLVFLFERQRETVDYRAEDFQQLSDTVEPFGLVDELKKYIIDRSPYIRSEVQELAVYPMKRCLEEISLSRVFGVEEF